MARRRSKKSTLARRVAAWRKLPKKALAYRPPHSSVFVIGLGIGLAIGLSVGVGLTWLDGKRAPAPVHTQLAETVPPPEAKPVAPPLPPAYIEQTEPVPPEQEAAPVTLMWPWALAGLLVVPVVLVARHRLLERQAQRRSELAAQGLILAPAPRDRLRSLAWNRSAAVPPAPARRTSGSAAANEQQAPAAMPRSTGSAPPRGVIASSAKMLPGDGVATRPAPVTTNTKLAATPPAISARRLDGCIRTYGK